MLIARRGLLGAALLTTAGGAAAAGSVPVSVQTVDRRRHAEAMRRIADYAERHVRDYGLPGLTLTVVDAQGFTGFVRVGYANLERREPVRPEHLFQIGSISKSFVGLDCVQLEREGKIALDQPLKRYLPEAPIPERAPITVQHLLNHTSGLPADAPVFADDRELWLGYDPGTHWSYSNTGYHLLGKMIERVEGRPLKEVTQRRVLTPLGMTAAAPTITSADRPRYATGYSPLFEERPFAQAGRLVTADWINSDDAAGCVAATAADMARYMRYLIELLRGQGAPLLPNEATPTYLDQASDAPGWAPKARYGNGLAIIDVEGRKLIQHTGGMVAFSSSMTLDPDTGVGVFASSNIGGTGYRPRDITIWGVRLLAAQMSGGKSPDAPPTMPRVETPAAFAGVYTARGGERLEVRAKANGLVLATAEGEARLVPYAKDSLVADHPRWSRLGFNFVREGERATRVWWGDTEFVAPGVAYTAASPRLQALAGLYENDSPWMGTITVFARGEDLWLWGTDKLSPLPAGQWRFGEEAWSPERISFGAQINGQPQRMTFSGTVFARRTL
jgi:D-alanyl-D-alanine carboxypeptidase